MAKSQKQIQINFESAKRRAAELEQTAQELKTLCKRDLDAALASLNNSWQGESARRFVEKLSQIKSKADQTANGLMASANTIRTIAQKVYMAEMRAAQIAGSNISK